MRPGSVRPQCGPLPAAIRGARRRTSLHRREKRLTPARPEALGSRSSGQPCFRCSVRSAPSFWGDDDATLMAVEGVDCWDINGSILTDSTKRPAKPAIDLQRQPNEAAGRHHQRALDPSSRFSCSSGIFWLAVGTLFLSVFEAWSSQLYRPRRTRALVHAHQALSRATYTSSGTHRRIRGTNYRR